MNHLSVVVHDKYAVKDLKEEEGRTALVGFNLNASLNMGSSSGENVSQGEEKEKLGE